MLQIAEQEAAGWDRVAEILGRLPGDGVDLNQLFWQPLGMVISATTSSTWRNGAAAGFAAFLGGEVPRRRTGEHPCHTAATGHHGYREGLVGSPASKRPGPENELPAMVGMRVFTLRLALEYSSDTARVSVSARTDRKNAREARLSRGERFGRKAPPWS